MMGIGRQNELEAENAALRAHVKRLEADRSELLSHLKWAMGVGNIRYSQRIEKQNGAYCDKVDEVRAAIARCEARS